MNRSIEVNFIGLKSSFNNPRVFQIIPNYPKYYLGYSLYHGYFVNGITANQILYVQSVEVIRRSDFYFLRFIWLSFTIISSHCG
jgi:hypothetical protein